MHFSVGEYSIVRTKVCIGISAGNRARRGFCCYVHGCVVAGIAAGVVSCVVAGVAAGNLVLSLALSLALPLAFAWPIMMPLALPIALTITVSIVVSAALYLARKVSFVCHCGNLWKGSVVYGIRERACIWAVDVKLLSTCGLLCGWRVVPRC